MNAKTGTEKVCEVCGKAFYAQAHRAAEARFCSRQCLGKGRTKRPRNEAEVTCRRCGKVFIVPKHRAAVAVYCSMACSARQLLPEEAGGKKRCPDCQEIKPLDAFYPSKNGFQGVSGYCIPCDKARRNARSALDRDTPRARAKAWSAAHPERKKDNDARWYSDNKDYANERGTAYYVANKPKLRAKNKEWRVANSAQITEQNRQKRIINGDGIRAKRRQHYADNKAAYIANARRREADKLRATPAWADHKLMLAFYERAEEMTRATGIAHHVDHIIPLRSPRVCGLHVHYNLQILTAEENLRKGNNFTGG